MSEQNKSAAKNLFDTFMFRRKPIGQCTYRELKGWRRKADRRRLGLRSLRRARTLSLNECLLNAVLQCIQRCSSFSASDLLAGALSMDCAFL
jgi:hypothetical protein